MGLPCGPIPRYRAGCVNSDMEFYGTVGEASFGVIASTEKGEYPRGYPFYHARGSVHVSSESLLARTSGEFRDEMYPDPNL